VSDFRSQPPQGQEKLKQKHLKKKLSLKPSLKKLTTNNLAPFLQRPFIIRHMYGTPGYLKYRSVQHNVEHAGPVSELPGNEFTTQAIAVTC
jgi:hypothetical protein